MLAGRGHDALCITRLIRYSLSKYSLVAFCLSAVKHETLTQCWCEVGPTLVQRYTNIGLFLHFFLDGLLPRKDCNDTGSSFSQYQTTANIARARCWDIVELMSGQRRRRWASDNSTLVHHLVFFLGNMITVWRLPIKLIVISATATKFISGNFFIFP